MLRVGSAADNAAYWSIATTMRSDNKALGTVKDALGLGAAKADVAYTAMNSAISVVDYADSAVGELVLEPGGGGRFAGVELRPRVTLARGCDPRAGAALHDRAAELCFVARSLAVPVRHRPETRVEDAGPAGPPRGERR